MEAAEKIGRNGLAVSMVTGDFAVPRNDEHGPDGLRNITPYLDLAETLGADLIRICMKKDEDIEWAQKASDEAAERNIRLAHQAHCASLFETVAGSERVLRAVGRTNFGIIYEPANWMAAGQNYGPETIKRLAAYIFNVYVQNHRLNPDGQATLTTWAKGRVPVDHIGIWDTGGVDFDSVFEGLYAIGYHGYVTVHQAFWRHHVGQRRGHEESRVLEDLLRLTVFQAGGLLQSIVLCLGRGHKAGNNEPGRCEEITGTVRESEAR